MSVPVGGRVTKANKFEKDSGLGHQMSLVEDRAPQRGPTQKGTCTVHHEDWSHMGTPPPDQTD